MKAKRQKKSHENRLLKPGNSKLPFIEHLHELRKRLFYVALSIGIWGAGAYTVQQQIVALLLKPAHNQQFIYTSVGGGIDFLFRVCIYTGIVFSIPIIVFQILRYIEPLVKKGAVRFVAWGSVASGMLAIAGMAFGYYIGLPAALHFLLHQFTTGQIHPLLTIQSYMSFITLYMLGSALLFQLPLILILINRIKPLSPKKLLGMERWVILLAFIGGGIMNPSPRVQDQILLAGPMILTYQIGILLIWATNRRPKRPQRVLDLRQKDADARLARLARFEAARTAALNAGTPVAARPVAVLRPAVASAKTLVAPIAPATPARPVQNRGRSYINDFRPRRDYRSFGRTPDALET